MTTPLDWKAPPFPPAKVLEGQYCRLEPIDSARHLDDIWAVNQGHDHIWDWMPAHPPQSRESYRELLEMMASKAGIVPFAVIDKADGKAKGHLWLMEIRPEHGVFEVGYITYSPVLQKTRVATEAIYLCGEYGFSLGYRRFEWKCNNLNEPSKRAALRFGFHYEGLFRQHMVVKGRNRDTAWFSILDSEWPARAQGFRRWLAPENFDANGAQKLSLAAFNQPMALAGTVPLRRATTNDIPAILALKNAAYTPNESIIGVPSLPRIADYAQVVAEHEVWLTDGASGLEAALVLEIEDGKFTLWSIAVAPEAAGRKLGRALMDFADERARALQFDAVHLYTHAKLIQRISWYERLGYVITHHQELADRRLTHMRKQLQKAG
ncbi:Protein N-acetyltransferase, RimJ/RimL family [Bosea sp. OK403]|uniref:GNAT family N-acetyltransferase n=1 Tax=Bosea sp. OK403 TaxID=1855286 RepID=UPI0008E10B41|nr:GNAT family N-acetyltransferase [Bosea sp. OK403]SFJ01243.1 Protein N-acetyltransferase, RimJ/RimL family [Bosea sp. OK403]